MNPVEAIIALKALGEKKPLDLAAMAELLERVEGLIEEELVGAFAFAQVSHLEIFEKLRSVELIDRLVGVNVAGRLGRVHAGTFLRHAVKDPHSLVSNAAHRHIHRLALPEVALPLGGGDLWQVTGWDFGRGRDRSWTRKKYPLRVPALTELRALESALGLQETELRAVRRYVEFTVPKRKGGVRKLAAPHPRLKQVQRHLLDSMFAPLPLHPASTAYAPKSSVVNNARPHVGRALVVKLDLQDFFPSIHFSRVEGLLLSLGMAVRSAGAVARLLTYRPRLASGDLSRVSVLPQGAPTSPVIANLIARRLDARLAGLAKKWSAAYTRYADDLTFSFAAMPTELGRFFWWVNAICQQEGFIENASKRRVMRAGGRQQVTGLVVNKKVSLPRDVRRKFKATLHNCEKHGVASQARGRPDFEQWLLGFAAWAAVAQPEVGAGWLARVRKVLAR